MPERLVKFWHRRLWGTQLERNRAVKRCAMDLAMHPVSTACE